MLITVSTAMPQATDLGFLLHKHPERVQSYDFAGSTAHVFYPDASEDRCTAALLLEVDPLAMIKGRRKQQTNFTLGHYVNDRAYAASSMLAVALGKVFKTALHGRCDARPELAAGTIPLTIEVACLPSRGDSSRSSTELVTDLFEPMGWKVTATPIPLDRTFPEWGDSNYVGLRLEGEVRLADALNHLYVLMPVLDDAKHYWVDDSEVAKLLKAGEGWLAEHPERELISRRYLAHQASIWRPALDQLTALDDRVPEPLMDNEPAPPPLAVARRDAVMAIIRELRPTRVVDLGCGEGALLQALQTEAGIDEIVGVDVAAAALTRAEKRLRIQDLTERQAQRLRLLQSSLLYRDQRLAGFDCAVLMEVIEHIDLDRLPVVERNLFAGLAPASVIITTPNAEFNARYPHLPAGTFRHSDHRFEWDRATFQAWAERVAAAHGYQVTFRPVGELDADLGPSTQLALFTRTDRGTRTDGASRTEVAA